MQKCENCNTKFSWSKLFWWTSYNPIECENCGTKHKITNIGKSTVIAMSILPMLIFIYFLSPFDNIFKSIGVGFLIGIIGLLFTPFVTRFTKVL